MLLPNPQGINFGYFIGRHQERSHGTKHIESFSSEPLPIRFLNDTLSYIVHHSITCNIFQCVFLFYPFRNCTYYDGQLSFTVNYLPFFRKSD